MPHEESMMLGYEDDDLPKTKDDRMQEKYRTSYFLLFALCNSQSLISVGLKSEIEKLIKYVEDGE
jgi:hypothetical protein